MLTIGIIGSAGRKDDAAKVSLGLFEEVETKVFEILASFKEPICLKSGGAAFIDSIAVDLYLKGYAGAIDKVFDLTLHLPCSFSFENCAFIDKGFNSVNRDEGNILNYYHRQFEKKTGINSLNNLSLALQRGASFVITPGFKERNSKVAESKHLIAATFGNGPKLKPGGSADTASKWLARKDLEDRRGFHINLNDLKVYNEIAV